MRPHCPRPTFPTSPREYLPLFPCENPAALFRDARRPRKAALHAPCAPALFYVAVLSALTPPLPSLSEASIRGHTYTPRLSIRPRLSTARFSRAIPRAPIEPTAKTRPARPFPMPKPPCGTLPFQKIQNKATKYENRVDIFKRFRYNKRKRGRLMFVTHQPCIRKCGSTPSYNRITGTLWTV